MSTIPLQPDCDPEDPEEAFLWALICLPGMESQAAMLVPPMTLRHWSRRLWDLGYRQHPELQTLKYVPPAGGQHWLDSAAGRWVPIDQPLPPEETAPSIEHLSHDEKLVLGERLHRDGYVPESPVTPEPDVATVEEVTNNGS